MLDLADLVEKYGEILTIPPAPVKFIKLVDAESDVRKCLAYIFLVQF